MPGDIGNTGGRPGNASGGGGVLTQPAPNNPVSANSTAPTVPGVVGTNATVVAGTAIAAQSGVGVYGGGTIGVQGTGGIGVYGKGNQFAGQFEGNVQITGILSVTDNANHTIAGNLTVGNTVTAGGLIANLNATIKENLTVGGTVNVAGDVVLANQDCAEDFDVGTSTIADPGTVLIIDEHGQLRESWQAYDKKVAGIVSGAHEFRPGLILGRHMIANDGNRRVPVALIGKVYCKVDAQYAPIEIGDLLTTSLTPGHAMKASDRGMAFGSVIGKALAPMESGRGLVPVLVALQ